MRGFHNIISRKVPKEHSAPNDAGAGPIYQVYGINCILYIVVGAHGVTIPKLSRELPTAQQRKILHQSKAAFSLKDRVCNSLQSYLSSTQHVFIWP